MHLFVPQPAIFVLPKDERHIKAVYDVDGDALYRRCELKST
ncbi:hypothetical protein BFJ68_g17567 [Fusarium oxysporum]|uniref:Uncharacterized protein n=1 Tax=Fusarium oxysporum TaxID=5507 RepID=A0A420NPG2_FUSOX|nr:hypothetical protein BFJ68_g17567 [Fusarium oxysporum]